MLNYSISISQKIEKISSYQSLKRMPTLRRNNRIKSIYSSLAIEANSLSLDQVRDVIDGNNVIGSQKEINEVKDELISAGTKIYELNEKKKEYN